MKTKHEFLEQCSSPTLYSLLLFTGEVYWPTLLERAHDYADIRMANVPGFYSPESTIRFGKRHSSDIKELIAYVESERVGVDYPQVSHGTDAYHQWMTLFSWNIMMEEMIEYLDN